MFVFNKTTATSSVLVLVLVALLTAGEATKSQPNSVSGNSSGILQNTTETAITSNSSSTRVAAPILPAPVIPPVSIVKIDGEKEVRKKAGGNRDGRYYSPYLSPYDQYYNPFPFYYPPQLGGSTGYGNAATSCAYAYPNRRYTCYGLGR